MSHEFGFWTLYQELAILKKRLSRWLAAAEKDPLSLSTVADDDSGGLRGRLLIDPSSLWPSLTRDVSPKEIVGVRTTIYFCFIFPKSAKNCFIKPFPPKNAAATLTRVRGLWDLTSLWICFLSIFILLFFVLYLLIKSTLWAFQTRYYSISIQLYSITFSDLLLYHYCTKYHRKKKSLTNLRPLIC